MTGPNLILVTELRLYYQESEAALWQTYSRIQCFWFQAFILRSCHCSISLAQHSVQLLLGGSVESHNRLQSDIINFQHCPAK